MRLDQLLVARGLLPSRAAARAAIEAGKVRVGGAVARAPSQKVGEDAVVEAQAAHPFVSRAGLKLDHALSLWPVRVEGRVVLDVGASTGGFTQACLMRGAARVYAVDVGHGQLHADVARDARVISLERQDARELTAEQIPEAPGLIVCDASFISLAKVLKVPLSLAAGDADLVTLVKPQFEMEGPSDVGRGGVVRDEAARRAALARARVWLEGEGWHIAGEADSPITGGDGNHEYLLWARRQ